jgi:Mce-associated membrane protein
VNPVTTRVSAALQVVRSRVAQGGARALLAPGAATGLLLLSIWLLWDGSARNDAEQAGSAAVAAARESIVAMGSYRPEDAEQSLTAARDRLTGAFLDAYTQAIQTVVIPNAKGKKMSSVVSVPAAGVVSAESDRAVLLAYVDQTLTVGREAPVANPARYRVTMQKVDGRWLVAGFDQI